MNLLDYMKNHRVYFDGAMGSQLQARGLKPGELPETWNLTHREEMTAIHTDYLMAGANILTTNTFGANALKYPQNGKWKLADLVTAALENAARAKRDFDGPQASFLALDIGPTGKLLKPLGELGFEEAVSLFSEVINIGKEYADLILIETMSDTMEMKAAVLAAKENCSLPVFATMTFDAEGRLMTGGTAESAVALLEGLRVDALGINCGLGPGQLKGVMKRMLAVSGTPLIFNPNAGLPRSENGKTVYDISPDEFVSEMKIVSKMGVFMLGGCCGTTPEYIRKLKEATKDDPPVWPQEKEQTVVSSYAEAVVISQKTVVIGERINPTGKKRFRRALLENDLDSIIDEGVRQKEAGADILDVNVGLPEIDEAAVLEKTVNELQSILSVPLQIDTSDPRAMEKALRIYNGKPLINSVNGKDETMRAVFPLAAKYGGAVVALPLDEKGIPDTADGRIKIAEKIIRTAASYGIRKKDILLDGLAMTVSADSRSACTALETIRRAKSELGVATILGVSNISFGLPQRENINAAFLTMAMKEGLCAAILNPLNEAMMRALYTGRVLLGSDPQCSAYIGRYAEAQEQASVSMTAAAQKEEAEKSLSFCIRKGLQDAAVTAAWKALETKDPLDVIQEEMIPSLDRVGREFADGTLFLPQLLMSAEAAKGAFSVIRGKIRSSGETETKKGKVILATVKGDIHDIGKNIVKVLLENYGFEVLDLGKDVPPARIADTAVREKVSLVGLSALMTTTVPSMEETIALLHTERPQTKIMVGGAVMTAEYAKTIHADIYCKDAMASVRYAEMIVGNQP